MRSNTLENRSLRDRLARRPSLTFVIATAMMAATAAGEEPALGRSGAAQACAGGRAPATQAAPNDQTPQPDAELLQSDGAFARMWNRQWFIGPQVFTFEGAPHAPKRRLPADFEAHGAIILAGGWLAAEAPDALVQLVRQMQPRQPVVLLVSSARQREAASRVLAERGLSPEKLQFLTVPTDTGWVRDFGPIFLDAGGALHAIDAAYGQPGRDRDEEASAAIAEQFEATTTATPLRWQGGNLLSNGEGLVVTTTRSINANIERGHDVGTLARFLNRHCGAEQVVVLEHLEGEPTGHVDMFACFTCPQTIIVGTYAPDVDPDNASVLDRNAARLAEVRTRRGPLKVVRIPMPSNDDGVWRSFMNVVFANGVLLVPTYPGAAAGEKALAVYRRLLPEWDVVGVDAERIARHEGGLRCVSLYIPENSFVSPCGPCRQSP